MRRVLAVLALCILGCFGAEEPAPAPGPTPPPPPATGPSPRAPVADRWAEPPASRTLPATAAGELVYAELAEAVAPLPPEFSSALPALPAEGWPATLPPRAWLRARLATGDPAVWDRLDASLAAALSGPDPLAAEQGYAELTRFLGGRRACDLALARHGAPATRRLADLVLAACDSPQARDRLAEPGTSPIALLSWGGSFRGVDDARLQKALAAALPDLVDRVDGWTVGIAAQHAGTLRDPEVSAALRAAHARAVDPDLKTTLAVALRLQADPEARALAAAVCDRPEPARGCAAPTDDAADATDPCLGLDYTTADPWQAEACLPALAAKDWAAARAAVAGVAPGALASAETLRQHPSAAAWEGALRAEGVLQAPCPTTEPLPLQLPALLVTCDQAAWFDVETGQWPNEHDALLTQLANLGGSPLADVVFGEAAPPIDATDPPAHVAPLGRYVLYAWMDGKRYTAGAEDLGDWYDLGAVVGMLNSLARERRSDARWVVLPTGDQTAIVALFTPQAREAARARGLTEAAGAGDAAADGKAAEARVLQELQAGEALPGSPD